MGTLVAVLLLIIAMAFRGLAVALKREAGLWLAAVARLGAWIALASSIWWTTAASAPWSAFYFPLWMQSLVLAIWAIDGIYSWRFRPVVMVSVVDLISLTLIVVGTFGTPPGHVSSSCLQSLPLWVGQWLLFIIGSGAAIVAGGNVLTSTMNAALADRLGPLPRSSQTALSVIAQEANQLTLVALGGGLILGLGWTWYQGDPRLLWMASAWLIAAMASTAWSLSRGGERWFTWLTVLAAAVALSGLWAAPSLHP